MGALQKHSGKLLKKLERKFAVGGLGVDRKRRADRSRPPLLKRRSPGRGLAGLRKLGK
jgi:hypothetical protein